MRNSLVLILLCLSTNLFAQLNKGDRLLAWQIDMTANNNYDSAFTYAKDACMESAHFSFLWNLIEPTSGNFDTSFISSSLDVIDIYFPTFNTKVELQLSTINTVAKEVPADLQNVPFDSPIMINRFKTFLDTVFNHIPNVDLAALNIGNESDVYMGTDSSQYIAYKTFLDSVVPYAKQRYQSLYGKSLKVGTVFTFDGLMNPATASLCSRVNSGLDIVAVTYYPLNPNFTMEVPSVVGTDFQNLVTLYPDTLQPIYFTECGYSSSTVCNSSELLQSQFFQNVFTAWDTHYANIKYLTIFKTTDWSQSEVDTFAVYYGFPNNNIFKEYLRALGVRTYPGNGTNKIAFETIKCELKNRNWCTLSCGPIGIEERSPAVTISVYPNPVKEQLQVSNPSNSTAEIRIYDCTGALIMQPRQLKGQRTIDVSALSEGIYNLIIIDGERREAKKFVKL